MYEFINNNWVVSIVSSIITLLIVPAFIYIRNLIRSRKGVFTGTYIAITELRYTREKIVELVKCRHIGKKVKGKIWGVVSFSNDTPEQNIQNLPNSYKFNGSVSERLLVISYYSIAKGDQSAGSLALNGNTTGTVFSGIWCGLEEGRIVSSSCTWIKSDKEFDLSRDRDEIINRVKLNSLITIVGSNATGKTSFAWLYEKLNK